LAVAPRREFADSDHYSKCEQYGASHYSWDRHIQKAHDAQSDEQSDLPPGRSRNCPNRFVHVCSLNYAGTTVTAAEDAVAPTLLRMLMRLPPDTRRHLVIHGPSASWIKV
jgi:hypothetical protein